MGSNNRMVRMEQNQQQQNSNTGSTGYEAKDKWRRLEVSPEAIDCLQLVREGTYGRVYSGTLLVKGCSNNNNKNLEHTINHSMSSNNNSNNNNNNNYNNDNEECVVETRDVLIKTVLGGWRLSL